MFSSATSRGRPAKIGAERFSAAPTVSAMEMVWNSMPRFAARMRASSFECWLEMTDGRLTPMTFFGPRASAAMTADEGGVDAAGEAEQGLLETGLVRVVANAEHEGVVDIGEVGLLEGGVDFRFLILDFRSRKIDDAQFLAKGGESGQGLALGISHDAAAVEEELVVAADGVDVGDRAAELAGGVGHELVADVALAVVPRAGGEVDHHIAALGGELRTGSAPL
jgi:hypothetical protein